MRLLSRVLDDLVRVPGTRFRFGLDALFGLVPGVGDAAGTVLSAVILVGAVRARVPLPVLARMGWNLVVDALLGLVPVVGDVADAAHRANVKNLRLLERAMEQGHRVETGTTGYLVRAIALVVAVLAVVVTLAVLAVWALLRVLGLVGQ